MFFSGSGTRPGSVDFAALLLLPPPPRPPTAIAISVAYTPPIRYVMEQLKRCNTATLDIIVPVDAHLSSRQNAPIATISALVAGIYALVTLLMDEEHIPYSGSNSIESKVLLMRHDLNSTPSVVLPDRQPHVRFDSLIDLTFLAKCQRTWDRLFITDGEEAEHLYRQTLQKISETYEWTAFRKICVEAQRVPGGLVLQQSAKLGVTKTVDSSQLTCILIHADFSAFDFNDKALLTVATFLLGPRPSPKKCTLLVLDASETEASGGPSMRRLTASREWEMQATNFLSVIGNLQTEVRKRKDSGVLTEYGLTHSPLAEEFEFVCTFSQDQRLSRDWSDGQNVALVRFEGTSPPAVATMGDLGGRCDFLCEISALKDLASQMSS